MDKLNTPLQLSTRHLVSFRLRTDTTGTDTPPPNIKHEIQNATSQTDKILIADKPAKCVYIPGELRNKKDTLSTIIFNIRETENCPENTMEEFSKGLGAFLKDWKIYIQQYIES